MEKEKKLYNAIAKEYKGLDRLCKIIQDSYKNNDKVELMHEDILPLLNVLDTFDGMELYEE